MAVYGYVRVSSADQHEDRQMVSMAGLKIPKENIIMDKLSGKNFNRPAYKALTEKLRPSDLIYIKSIDRLGRNYDEILNQWRILTNERGVDIAVIDMPILDTRNGRDLVGTFLSDTVLALLSFVAQNERENVRQRQREGIAAARSRGVRFGQPVKKPSENFGAAVKQWERQKLTFEEALTQTGLKEATFYRRLREYRLIKKDSGLSKGERIDSGTLLSKVRRANNVDYLPTKSSSLRHPTTILSPLLPVKENIYYAKKRDSANHAA